MGKNCDLRLEEGQDLFGDVGDAVQDQEVAGLVDEVHAIIEVSSQGLKILAVKGGNKGRINALEDLVIEFIALVFNAVKLIAKCDSFFGGSSVDLSKNFDARNELVCLLGEEFKEIWALRSVADPHNVPPIVLRLPQGNRHPLHTAYSSSPRQELLAE